MIARSTFLRERDTLAALRANDASDEVIKNQEKLTQDLFKEFDKQRQGYYNSKNEKVALIRSQFVEERQAQTEANKKSSDDRKEAAKKERDELKAERRKKEEEAIAYGKASIEAELIRQREASTKLFKDKAEAEDKYESEQEAKRDARIKRAFDINLEADLKQIELSKARRAEELAAEQALLDAKREMTNQEIDLGFMLISVLQNLNIKNKAIQKAALLANSALSIAQIINNTNAGAAKEVASKGVLGLGTGAILYAKMALQIGSVVASTAKGLKGIGGGGSAGGGGGAGGSAAPSSMGAGASTSSAAPQFNVVGTSGALASQVQSVTSPQAPIKAFVVSNDVTTAQSLDRNIVKSATLG
jgi:hypothetical protein